ncbi:MAG: ABC transporter permease [Lachnospiraceae bacterium]|nr:ABC transporter permease [Lachnospiraceae bacterium]
MKKSDYIGWQEVFRFSLTQGLKEKAYYGSLIFFAIVLILSQPVISLIQSFGGEEEAYHSEVTDFTIYDETGLEIDYAQALVGEGFEDIVIHTDSSMTFEEHVKLLEDSVEDEEAEPSTELIVQVKYEDAGYFNMSFVKASNADLSEDDCEQVADTFYAFFDEARIDAMEVTAEQLAFLNKTVDTKLEFVTETGEIVPEEEKAEGISMEEYMILLMGITVVTMIISLSGASVATSIVTEKSTKVVEYLMINVRPMALIVGKILSCLLLVIIQFAVIGISFGISSVLKLLLFGEQEITVEGTAAAGTVEMSAVMELLSGISLVDVLIAVVVILGGVLFYCILAGLAGASVSKMDEITEGLKLYNMVMVVGAYLGIGMCIVLMSGGDNQLFVNICSLVPISAPFVVPACVLLGKISMSIALISMVLILVVTGLLFAFTAKVYESMIFYNGSVLKFKDILMIAKNRTQAERKEEKQHE